jgi:uncharacterized protein
LHFRYKGLSMSTLDPALPLPEPGRGLAVAAPLLAEERLASLDLIRGVAILAILPANLVQFSGPAFGNQPVFATPLDHVVSAVILLLVDVKFITLLSILFGAGLGLQFDRAQARGDRRFPRYYLWRQFLLLMIGVCHALLLWWGDILTAYAIVGALALGVTLLGRGWVRGLAIFGLVWNYTLMLIFLVVALLFGHLFAQSRPARAGPSPDDRPVSLFFGEGTFEERQQRYSTPQNQKAIYRHGSFADLLENRAYFYGSQLIGLPFGAPGMLACFLIGVMVVRAGLFHDPQRRSRLVRWFLGLGLGIGVPLHVVAVVVYLANPRSQLPGPLNQLGALPQALLYLVLLIMWSESGVLARLQSCLRAVGRMALTNYLMQSLLCTLVFYGYGLGLYGRIGLAQTLPLLLGIWVLEMIWSPLWLRYFSLGPVEWLWRTLAGRRRQAVGLAAA